MIIALAVVALVPVAVACTWMFRQGPRPSVAARDPDWGDWPSDQRGL